MVLLRDTLDKVIALFREVYHDPDKGRQIAVALANYADSQTGKSRMDMDDPQYAIHDVVAIAQSITHDHHIRMVHKYARSYSYQQQQQQQQQSHQQPPRVGLVNGHLLWFSEFEDISYQRVRETYHQIMSMIKPPLIIDLTVCHGGMSDTLVYLLSHFFPTGTLLYRRTTRLTEPQDIVAVDNIDSAGPGYTEIIKYTGPVYLMVGSGTASAGEIFAHTLMHHGRASGVYGHRTLGSTIGVIDTVVDDFIVNIPGRVDILPAMKNKPAVPLADVPVVPDHQVGTPDYIRFIYNIYLPCTEHTAEGVMKTEH